MVGSFYDADLDEGCAFEEVISFHGGIGGFQTRPCILNPKALDATASSPAASTPSPKRGLEIVSTAAEIDSAD